MPRSGLAVRDSGTVLGFDFGEKRIGVAVGDIEVGLAHPLRLIAAKTNDQRFAQIAALIRGVAAGDVRGRVTHQHGWRGA